MSENKFQLKNPLYLSYIKGQTGEKGDAKFIAFNKDSTTLIDENGEEISLYDIDSNDIYSLALILLTN